ncbi:MAG: ABC transporter permease [Candidatus Zixiibacteriota bacterium]|nr:MAG: ABC transporter permease [candidate division Zixibacteria bacterium]
MQVVMYISQFLRDMRSQKLRTLLTLFGIIWGTAAVVLLMAIGKGIHAENQRQMHGLGEGIVILWGGRTSQPFEGFGKGRRIPLREEDAHLLKREIREMWGVSPEYSRWSTHMKYKDNAVTQNMVGIYPIFGEMRNIIPEMGGRFINRIDLEQKKRVVFIGDQLKKDLFGEEEAIGKYIIIDNVPFLVVGVLKEKEQDSSYSGRDENKAFVPASTFAAMYGYRYVNDMIFKPTDPRQTELVKEKVYQVLGKKYKFDPADKEALSMWDTTEMAKFLTYFFLAFRIFLVAIGTATLIVGGIGVSNIMHVVVEERTKEVGIKMSLGAKKAHVLLQFIFETFVITFVGGTVGFLFSVGVIKLFPVFGLEEYLGTPQITYTTALIAVGILGLVGLISGYFPARRAANLNPVQALKL